MPKIFIFQSLREKNLILGGNFNRVDSAYWRALGIQQFYLLTIAGYFDILRVGDVQIYFSFILKLFFLSCGNGTRINGILGIARIV